MTRPNKSKERCIQVFERLKQDAVLDNQGRLMWSGGITEVYKELGLNGKEYSRTKNLLIHNSSIVWHERGTGGGAGKIPTVIELIRHPNEIKTWLDEDLTRDLTDGSASAIMAQKLNDFSRQLGGVNVPEALRDIAIELSSIRREIQELKEKGEM